MSSFPETYNDPIIFRLHESQKIFLDEIYLKPLETTDLQPQNPRPFLTLTV